MRKIRQLIRGNQAGYDANAALTKTLKGASVPLVGGKVDTGGISLFQAIRANTLDDYTVFAGVKFVSEKYDIAETLHEGATIPVTDKMRNLFRVLFFASVGRFDPGALTGRAAELWRLRPGGWKRLNPSTTAIIIPSRPFIERAFADPGMRREVKENWETALQAAFAAMARR